VRSAQESGCWAGLAQMKIPMRVLHSILPLHLALNECA
jgi:hypothetical protein